MLGSERLVAFGATVNASHAARFYGEILGLPVQSESPFAVVLDANGVELRLQKVATLTPQSFTMLGWQVRDLDAILDELTSRGIALERYPGMVQDARGAWLAPSGARIAWFKDPDGNVLSVAQYPAG
jgi:catechol 2,3-dioxygenase-like lactoylglutathione lyase family enzyme